MREVIIRCGFFILNVIDIFDKVNQIFGIHVKLREKYDFMTLQTLYKYTRTL